MYDTPDCHLLTLPVCLFLNTLTKCFSTEINWNSPLFRKCGCLKPYIVSQATCDLQLQDTIEIIKDICRKMVVWIVNVGFVSFYFSFHCYDKLFVSIYEWKVFHVRCNVNFESTRAWKKIHFAIMNATFCTRTWVWMRFISVLLSKYDGKSWFLKIISLIIVNTRPNN